MYMPEGADPSCIRQEVCRYCVRRLFGSRAWAVSGSNNTQARQAARVAAIAVRGRLKRSRSGRREAGFPMLYLHSARQWFIQMEAPDSFRPLSRVVKTWLSGSHVKLETKRLSPAFRNCRSPGAKKIELLWSLRTAAPAHTHRTPSRSNSSWATLAPEHSTACRFAAMASRRIATGRSARRHRLHLPTSRTGTILLEPPRAGVRREARTASETPPGLPAAAARRGISPAQTGGTRNERGDGDDAEYGGEIPVERQHQAAGHRSQNRADASDAVGPAYAGCATIGRIEARCKRIGPGLRARNAEPRGKHHERHSPRLCRHTADEGDEHACGGVGDREDVLRIDSIHQPPEQQCAQCAAHLKHGGHDGRCLERHAGGLDQGGEPSSTGGRSPAGS